MAGPLTAIWEAKLKADGLASLDDGDVVRAPTPKAAMYRDDETPVPIGPKLRAEFWRQATEAAERLPYSYRRARFIRLAVEYGNVARAARECGLTHRMSRWAWRRFLVFAGLPAPLVKGSQGRKRPTKPGQVRIEAGRYREERAA